jgi:hypothetical protein
MKKISNCVGMLRSNTKAISVTGLLYYTATNQVYVVPYYVVLIMSKAMDINCYDCACIFALTTWHVNCTVVAPYCI